MQIDMQKLEVAMKYIERIADGKNPVNNKPTEEDSVLNNPNVIRCMYFVKEVLAAVKENNGMIGGRASKPSKSPFPFECLSGFEYVDDTSIAHFMNRLKGLALDPNVRGIGTKPVTDWLKRKGYLIDVQDKYTGRLALLPAMNHFGGKLYGQSYSNQQEIEESSERVLREEAKYLG